MSFGNQQENTDNKLIKELVDILKKSEKTSFRLNITMIILTAVIVILTVGLVVLTFSLI